eukprot:4565212-Pleurochrysis_carterae.AAC.2
MDNCQPGLQLFLSSLQSPLLRAPTVRTDRKRGVHKAQGIVFRLTRRLPARSKLADCLSHTDSRSLRLCSQRANTYRRQPRDSAAVSTDAYCSSICTVDQPPRRARRPGRTAVRGAPFFRR